MNSDKPKKSSILMALWIQGFTWLIIVISGTFYMAASAANDIQHSELLWNNTINALTCHVPQWEVNQVVHHSVNTLPAAQLSEDSTKSFNSNLQLLAEIELMQGNVANTNKRDTHVYFLERNKRSEDQSEKRKKRLSEPHKINLKKYHKIKKLKYNNLKKHMSQKELQDVNTTKNNTSRILESLRHTSENEKNLKENKKDFKNLRNKRSSVQTNALGFKIIQPTDSILQGHVITNKLNPDLVGHVILNKTSININGHEITFKQDLFIREHDPLPAKMHRLHRGRPDIRFLTDLMNMTEGHNTTNKRSVRQTPIRERVSSKVNRDQSKVLLIKINDKEERTKRDTQQINLNKNYSSEIILSRKDENLESQNKQIDADNIDQKSKDTCCSDNEFSKENRNSDYTENVSASEFIKSNIWNAVKSEVRDSEVIKYDASKSNIVRITDKKISEEKHNDNSDVIYAITKIKLKNCGYTFVYGWVVVIAYIVFSISSIQFLTLCQSSVFTIAMMSPALPLSGVWWAMFSQNSDGSLLMHPGLSGELICALLGLPIVTLGLMLLFKAHFFQISFSYPNQGILNRIYNDNTRMHESHINICDPNNENHIQHMA